MFAVRVQHLDLNLDLSLDLNLDLDLYLNAGPFRGCQMLRNTMNSKGFAAFGFPERVPFWIRKRVTETDPALCTLSDLNLDLNLDMKCGFHCILQISIDSRF